MPVIQRFAETRRNEHPSKIMLTRAQELEIMDLPASVIGELLTKPGKVARRNISLTSSRRKTP
jgi:hypothetical protein